MNERIRLVAVLLSLVGTGVAWADRPSSHGGNGGAADSVSRVERQAGGKVIRAETMQRDGREVTRYRVLTADGRVRTVQDDPQADGRSGRQQPPVRKEPSRPRDEDSDPF